MKFDLIHIGMMKTGTTYFQNVWLRNNNYNLSHKGTFKFLKNQRESIKINKDIPDNNIQFDQTYSKDKANVLSNEGFSTVFLNDYKYQEKIPQFIERISFSLSDLGESCGLLVLVRNPLDWIKSIYIQSIKEGNSESIQEFIDNQIVFLFHSLNLNHILNSYSRYFNNVLVLPFELLKDDEDKLWQTISDEFNVPLVGNRMQKLNVSLDLKRVFILSKMNEMSDKAVSTIAAAKSYTREREKKNIINSYKQSGKWVHRRFVEHGKEKEIDELYNLFNLSVDDIPDDFYEFELPDDLIKVIENNYFDVLEGQIEDKYLRSYRKKFIKNLI